MQALPSCMSLLLGMVQENVNMIFLGHLNQPALVAGVGLGNVITNVFGFSLIVGLNGALETLVSQAYGAKNLHLCGIYLNRGRFVILAMFIPSVAILMQTEKIFVMTGQDPEVSRLAGEYVIAYLPGLIMLGMIDC